VRAASDGEGQGATFEIRLPADRAPERRSAPAESAVAADDTIPDVDFGGRLILVVDDDEATRELLSTILVERRAEVVAVGSVAEALAQFAGRVPAAVIADIGMPGEDGLSLIRRIRRRSRTRGGAVPAVALSAYARSEDRQAALDAGFTDFLTKPAMPADVVRAVVAVMRSNEPPPRRERRPRSASVTR
jgi:CheY-like chemotaxis protein